LRQTQAASALNPLNDSLQVAKQLDNVVRKSPQVKDVFTIVGSRQGEPNKGRLYVKLNSDRLINKNAILIVDYINQLRSSELNRTEAILQAGPIRLRPILMTTASTILGMLPLALGLGAGAELRAPMAVAIIGGLTTATLLSLIVVPVVYALLDDLRYRKRLISVIFEGKIGQSNIQHPKSKIQ
jgi:multidrug efflux pump subunit AcrB